MKLDLENIDWINTIKMDQDLVAKLDIGAIYPPITYNLVAQAVRHYSKGFSNHDKARVEVGLDTLSILVKNIFRTTKKMIQKKSPVF